MADARKRADGAGRRAWAAPLLSSRPIIQPRGPEPLLLPATERAALQRKITQQADEEIAAFKAEREAHYQRIKAEVSEHPFARRTQPAPSLFFRR